jgi:chromosome partitioning protein
MHSFGRRLCKAAEGWDKHIYDVFDDQSSPVVSIISGSTRKKSKTLRKIKPYTLVKPGFDLLLGNLGLFQLDMGGATGREHRLKRYLESFKEKNKYDFVIIDSPPTPSAWMTSALLASDYYLVPVKPEPLSQIGMDLLRSVIHRCTENHGHSISCLGLVLTIADAHTVAFKQAVSRINKDEEWKAYRFAQHLPKRTGVARDQGSQILILDSSNTDAKSAMARIVTEFTKRVAD